jgi:hypothetical protein
MKTLLSAILFCAFTAVAENDAPLKELSSIHDFAFGGIGAAGTTSKGEIAFRQVLQQPSAEKDFVDLLTTGNPQARCYALVALHGLNPALYAERVREFEGNQSKVSVIAGCMIMEEPMASVVTNISNGRYDSYLKAKER